MYTQTEDGAFQGDKNYNRLSTPESYAAPIECKTNCVLWDKTALIRLQRHAGTDESTSVTGGL